MPNLPSRAQLVGSVPSYLERSVFLELSRFESSRRGGLTGGSYHSGHVHEILEIPERSGLCLGHPDTSYILLVCASQIFIPRARKKEKKKWSQGRAYSVNLNRGNSLLVLNHTRTHERRTEEVGEGVVTNPE